jgi:hypothetical protein
MTIGERICEYLFKHPELRYRQHVHPLGEHCYVASESLYHALGGAASGWTPCTLRMGPDDVHWWLRDRSGRVLDLTAAQYDAPVDYEKGTGRGFLTKQPSRRAQTVLRALNLRWVR